MKTTTQEHQHNAQKEGNQRADKKKTDIRFNSAIFFQIGLVVALLASAWVMTLNIGEKTNPGDLNTGVTIDEPVFVTPVLAPKVVEVKQPIAKLKRPPVQPVITNSFKIVDNDTKTIETKIAAPDAAPVIPDAPVNASPTVNTPIVNSGPKDVISVEFLPIYPGCETAVGKEAMMACMSDKIGRFVGKKFDTSVAEQDSGKVQKIYVEFKIDKNGYVTDIKARAPDKNLEKEAQRVISKLPEFTPGKMGDVPVDVMYRLPITFKTN